MSYAVPSDLISWYGAEELSGLAQPDDGATVSAELFRAAMAGDDLSSWTTEEQAAAEEAVARVEAAIDHAGRLMDSYLCLRYGLPIDDTRVAASPLPRLCGDIARHALWDDRPAAEVQQGFERAMAWLREVAAGNAALDGVTQSRGAGLPRINSGRRVF